MKHLLASALLCAASLGAQTVVSVRVEGPSTMPVGSAPVQLVAVATFSDGLVAVWNPISVKALTLIAKADTGHAGTALMPFTVQVLDTSGRAAAALGASVTVTKASGPGTKAVGALGGTRTATTTQEGRATFRDLTVNAAGTYTLTFTSGTSAVTSGPIVVKACALAKRKTGC